MLERDQALDTAQWGARSLLRLFVQVLDEEGCESSQQSNPTTVWSPPRMCSPRSCASLRHTHCGCIQLASFHEFWSHLLSPLHGLRQYTLIQTITLLLLRTWVWFPAPIMQLTTPCNLGSGNLKCTCVYVHHMHAVPLETRRGRLIPWSWS